MIKIKNKLQRLSALLFGFLIVPVLLFAQTADKNSDPNININFKNPLRANSIQGLLLDVLSILIQVGAIIAVLAFVYAGFKFIAARGNQDEIKKARENLWYVAIGTIILLGANIIVTIIKNTVDQLKS